MERKSLSWIWIAIGGVAIGIFIVAGVGQKARLPVPSMPSPTQPIIVEPIQPSVVPAAGATRTSAAEPTVSIAQVPPQPALAQAGAAVKLPAEGTERVRKIQQALHAAGYEPGPIDGKMGKRTQNAIRRFQEANGLSVDGKVGPKTWGKLEAYLQNTTAAETGPASAD